MNCVMCNTPLAPEARFCNGCGAPVPQAAETGAPTCALHPSLSASPCPHCGTFACTACLVTGADGTTRCKSCEGKGEQTYLVWDQKNDLGIFRRYGRTCWQVMFSPRVTFEQMRPDGSLGSSLGFTILSAVTGFLTTLLAYGVLIGGMVAFAPKSAGMGKAFGDLGPGAGVGIVIAGVFGYLLLIVVMMLGAQLVMGTLEHLLLRAMGGTATWLQSMRAYSLSLAPNLCGLVPICSIYVMPFWSLTARVFAYKGVHKVSWGKAIVAAVGPSVALGCLFIGAYAALIATVMTKMK